MIIDNEYEKQHNLGPYTAKQGTVMTGAQAIIASLEAEGVDTVFGYPGGQAIKIYDALYDSKKIRHILSRQSRVQRMRLMGMRVQRARRVSLS